MWSHLLSPHNLWESSYDLDVIDYLYLFFIAKFIPHFAKRIVDWFEMAKVQCWWAKAKLVCSPKFGEVGEKLKMAPRPCIYAEVLWINAQQFSLGLFAGFTYVYQDILTKVLILWVYLSKWSLLVFWWIWQKILAPRPLPLGRVL